MLIGWILAYYVELLFIPVSNMYKLTFIVIQALYYKKYSTASDVWSYGALMYEIWSVGRKPYEKYDNETVLF